MHIVVIVMFSVILCDQSEHIRCSGLNTETSDLADESMNMSTSTSSSNINNTNITDVPNNANNNTTITTDDVASNSNSTGDGTANTNGNSNGNRNSSHDAYINKYLPGIWSELKNANADKYLLTLKKLQIPAQQLDASLKICILNYLNAIEPIAFVNASQLLNNSCGYMVIREHVSVLHTISTRSFRCLKSYKISISNAYVNTTQVVSDELKVLDENYANCLNELVKKAANDFDSLKPRLTNCLENMFPNNTLDYETTTIPPVTEVNNNENTTTTEHL